jgi:hypothetical protein
MGNRERDVGAIKIAQSLLKRDLIWEGWFVNFVPQPLSYVRGLYDLILINPRIHPSPIFIRIERTKNVIRNIFDFESHFPSEIFLTTNNSNMILFVLAPNGLFIFNPKTGLEGIKRFRRNDRIRSELFL